MELLSPKLRSVEGGIGHWCPGCNLLHVIWLSHPTGANWQWDGNVEAPTFAPSVRCFTTYDEEHKPLPNGEQRTLCHYFLRAGMLEFCGDSPHEFAGKTTPLPDLPEEWR